MSKSSINATTNQNPYIESLQGVKNGIACTELNISINLWAMSVLNLDTIPQSIPECDVKLRIEIKMRPDIILHLRN
jgi:hypothetical protein